MNGGPHSYTVVEAAERLRICTRTLRRMIAAGEITSIDIRRTGAGRARLRITAAELDRYMHSRAIPA